MAKRLKRPRDSVRLAKLVGDIATGQVKEPPRPAVRPAVPDLATVDGDERRLLVTRKLEEARAARCVERPQVRRSTKGS